MKKIIRLFALISTLSTVGYSASIDHIQTYTPEYGGNQAQTGMINKASVYYNPAGLVQLENGAYLHIGLQLAVGEEKMKYKGQTYKADLLQPIPNFAMYKVKDNRAFFWTFGGIAGGGDLKYKDGVPGTAVISDILPVSIGHSQVEGTHLYTQNTLGGAFAINDKLSLSMAGRMIYGVRKLKGELKNGKILGTPVNDLSIDSKRTAYGFGLQLGANYKVNDKLNLALRYDSKINLNFKSKDKTPETKLSSSILPPLGFSDFYSEYKNGTKLRRDLPAILALGASYKINDDWIVALSGNYYFNKDAKLDNSQATPILTKIGNKHIEAQYDNGWEIALGTEYRLNHKWALLGSVNYAYTGAKISSYDDVEYALNSVTLGAGVKYNYSENSELIFSIMQFIYDSEKGNYTEKYSGKNIPNPTYDKNITAFGVAYTMKF